MYIHLLPKWPQFKWEEEQIITILAEVRNLQGRLLGKMGSLGFELQEEAVLETVTLEVVKNHEIEGEALDAASVKSSVARKLGLDFDEQIVPSKQVDGAVEVILDATQKYHQSLTKNRLFGWHNALFPTGRSGIYTITIANWRQPEQGPMQVVSGALGKERIHFEAPSADRIPQEMELFLDWFNRDLPIDPVLKAAIAHLWFLTIHPFDDGNGRLARAITEMQLARSDQNPRRFYSMSNQILTNRKSYYEILENTQKGVLDLTDWLIWFLKALKDSILLSDQILSTILIKAEFWKTHRHRSLNERQRTMINKLFNGFKGKLSTSKWAKMCKCSKDTALRDIKDLEEKGILIKEIGGGRSTRYILKVLASGNDEK